MILFAAIFGLSIMTTGDGAAQQPGTKDAPGAYQRYSACLRLSQSRPLDALDSALAWQAELGGLPARHCRAVALVALERYGDAAELLSDMVRDLQTGRGLDFTDGKATAETGRLLVDMMAQLGNAQLLGGEIFAAYETLTQALLLAGDQPNYTTFPILMDRARAAILNDDWPSALNDLIAARRQAPNDLDVLILLASSYRETGKLDDADKVISDALILQADYPPALMERAQLHIARDDLPAARADWYLVMRRQPDSPIADLAQRFLNATQLDIQSPD